MVKAYIMNLQSVYNLMAAKYATNNLYSEHQNTGDRKQTALQISWTSSTVTWRTDRQTDRHIADALIGFCLRVRFDHLWLTVVLDVLYGESSVVFGRPKYRNFADIELKQCVVGCNLTPFLVFI